MHMSAYSPLLQEVKRKESRPFSPFLLDSLYLLFRKLKHRRDNRKEGFLLTDVLHIFHEDILLVFDLPGFCSCNGTFQFVYTL
mmetsp:Transcript_3935/g.5308  ORF Transcript_3935/g.5308 Transcript_3935/m.5308 type:complete len:83 (-) Transcript_3935:158-406(-)